MSTLNNGDLIRLQYKIEVISNGYHTFIDMYANDIKIDATVGSTFLLSGINDKLLTMSPGDIAEFELTPDKAFGTYDVANILDVDKNLVSPTGDEIVIGQTHTDKNTRKIGKVVEINNELVKVDFNHPAADKNVNVNLTVIEKLNT